MPDGFIIYLSSLSLNFKQDSFSTETYNLSCVVHIYKLHTILTNPFSPSLLFFLSLSLSLLSVCLSLSLSLLSDCLPVCLSQSVCLSVCLSLPPLSLFCLSLPLSCLSVCLSVSLSFFLPSRFCLSVSVSVCLSACLSPCLSLSLSLSLFLISLSQPFPLYLPCN